METIGDDKSKRITLMKRENRLTKLYLNFSCIICCRDR